MFRETEIVQNTLQKMIPALTVSSILCVKVVSMKEFGGWDRIEYWILGNSICLTLQKLH
jgi:hypothetical protein